MRVAREGVPHPEPGRPLIVYCNHPSWWDPAIMFVLGDTLLPAWEGFGPMEAEALKQYGVMRKLGVFGLEPGAKGAVRFLQVADHVLSGPRRALWITAEGRFTDARVRPVRIRPGIAHLARRATRVTILPLAFDFTFWNESKPEALARFGPADVGGRIGQRRRVAGAAGDGAGGDDGGVDRGCGQPRSGAVRLAAGRPHRRWRRVRRLAARGVLGAAAALRPEPRAMTNRNRLR